MIEICSTINLLDKVVVAPIDPVEWLQTHNKPMQYTALIQHPKDRNWVEKYCKLDMNNVYVFRPEVIVCVDP